MSIGAYELLSRHVEDTGPLKGKVLSDVTVDREPRIGFGGVLVFDLPDTSGEFKKFCRGPLNLKFKKTQRLPQAAHSFIESGYRGLKEAGALLIELVFRNGPKLYFEIDSPGKVSTKPFGGREGQLRFDMTDKYRAKIVGVYQLRQYVLVGTIFQNMTEAGAYIDRFHKRFLGQLMKGRDVRGLTQTTVGQTSPISRRISEPWFTAPMNLWLPKEFLESLDEDALAVLFPPTFLESLGGQKVHSPKVKMTPETRKAMKDTVKKERQYIATSDEDLVAIYEDIPGAQPMPYEHDYGAQVQMVCSLAVELRVVRGGAVLRAMVGA